MYIFLIILMSYILGSIPNALIIGKVFFKKDVRQYGSGNLGGSNTGRVLGKKIGLLVMILDLLKSVVAVFLRGIWLADASRQRQSCGAWRCLRYFWDDDSWNV